MFFEDWQGVLRAVIMCVITYPALILFLRVSGSRTLAKLNAFDLVVTVALGSTLATIVLSKEVALVEGLTALALLILLQYVAAWLIVRSPVARRLLKGEPRLLHYRGHFLSAAMRSARLTEADIRSAVRLQGVASLEDVEAVVLETDGSLSVVTRPVEGPSSALANTVAQAESS
jgi:uncharacterized membrane protein YcaP (DUF421 family)